MTASRDGGSFNPAPIVVIGGGRMGDALVGGLLASGHTSVVVVEKDALRRAELQASRPGIPILGNVGSLGSEVGAGTPVDAVLAVKPADVDAVCVDLVSSGLGIRRVLSIAAGVTLAALERRLEGIGVIRAMPNTPALVGAGAAAISPGRGASPEDVSWARSVLEAVGTVVELPESSLDAVTGLSGSGPAYVFLLAEALVDAGVLVGLPRPVASRLTVQTLLGAARMLAETGEEPVELRAAVTSPAGTTAAGLRALEAAGFRNAILEAVSAAADRARQLAAG
jgi:pyrroline-5-carboxylate reductase